MPSDFFRHIFNRHLEFESMEQTPLHENINHTVLKSIPNNIKKLIDIGCMSGGLAREYRKRNSSAYLIGVDLVQEYIDIAAPHFNEVHCINIEKNLDSIIEKHNDIDCWVMGDVLEHLIDPWKFLENLKKCNQGTKFIICLPNFQHWTIQYKVLLGDLFYEDSGLMDKSHLRIFTRHTIIKYLQKNGYVIDKIELLINSNPLMDNKFQHLINFAIASGYNKELYIKESTAYQYVINFSI